MEDSETPDFLGTTEVDEYFDDDDNGEELITAQKVTYKLNMLEQ